MATEIWAIGYALEPTNLLLQTETRKNLSFYRATVSLSIHDGVVRGSSAVSKEWVRDSLLLARDESEFQRRLQASKFCTIANFQNNRQNDYISYGMVSGCLISEFARL